MPPSTIKEMVENPHWIYKQYAQYWNFLAQSYEGGIDYTQSQVIQSKNSGTLIDSMFKLFVNGVEQRTIQSGNLFMHPKERAEDYDRRVAMSYYYNLCAPIIDIYKNHLLKDSVNQDFESIEKQVEPRLEDIDNRGSSLEEFRKELSEHIQLYGHSYVVVDSLAIAEDNVKTYKDQLDLGAFPYCTIHPPQSIINWSLDRFGMPYWVLLREYDEANAVAEAYDKNKVGSFTYKLWTREYWARYDSEYKLMEVGLHPVGAVPIVCVYNKRSKKARGFLGISEIADIAFIARDIYNSCSELRQILRDQTFAFLALEGNASDYSESIIGTNKGLVYPQGTKTPAYVSPPSDNAQTYFNHIDRQVSKCFQLAKLEGGSAAFNGQSAVVQSGVSKAWDFNETNSALSEKAANLEDGELKIWKIYAAWTGQQFDGSIQYPNEFSVSTLMDDLNEAEKIARVNLGKTFIIEVKKAIQKKKFPRASEEELEKMESELEGVEKENETVSKMVNRFNFLRNGQPTG